MRISRIDLDQDIEIVSVLSIDENSQITDMSYNNPNHSQVLKNRKDVCDLLQTDFSHCVCPNQCHTTHFKLVDLTDGGKGMYSKEDAIKETDALITNVKDLWLWSFHADCCSVMIYAKDQSYIASIHSGWKGTVQEISKNVITYMKESLHCDPKYMLAFVGPTINQENFEAMDDIIQLVNKMSFDTHAYYIKKDDSHYLLDHKGLIKATLMHCGIREENIKVSEIDTYTNEDYFSYRRNKTTCRNVTMIKLK